MENKNLAPPGDLAGVQRAKDSEIADALQMIDDALKAETARADLYAEALQTLYVNAIRHPDPAKIFPYVAPLCKAALDGRTLAEGLADAEAAIHAKATGADQ